MDEKNCVKTLLFYGLREGKEALIAVHEVECHMVSLATWGGIREKVAVSTLNTFTSVDVLRTCCLFTLAANIKHHLQSFRDVFVSTW